MSVSILPAPDVTWQEAVLRLQEAGAAVAAARAEEAETFLRYRIKAATDNQARAMAVVETKSELDKALAEYETAKAYLQIAVVKAAREKHT